MLNNYLLLRGSHTARSMARVHTTLAPARLMQVAATLLLVMALFLGNVQTASASHFRYGNISATPVASDPTGKTIQYKINLGFRRSYGSFSISSSNIVVGATLNNSGDGLNFYYGDGGSELLNFTVTSVDIANDQFYAEATINRTYASAGTVTAYFTTCCRISSLQNNATNDFYVPTTVTVGAANRSPIATLSPIVNLAAGRATATFQIPANDPDGNPLTFSLAASSDLGGITFVQPTGLSISSTGLITYSTVGFTNGQLYNSVVKISDGQGAITYVDFLIQISGSGNLPTFTYGGTNTPANSSVISASIGTPVTFNVVASDVDAGDVVTLAGFGIPAGATFSPTAGNPASGGFSFMPTGTGTFVINFTATDVSGGQVQSSVTIQVGTSVTPPVSGSALQLTMPTYVCATGAFTFNTTGGDGTPITFSAIGITSARVSNTSSLLDDVDAQLAQDIRDQKPNVQPLLLKASQSGVNVTYTWNALAACAGTTTPPPSTTTSACGSPTATIGQALALVGPTYDCVTGVIKFNATGGNGSPILFSAIGICSPTTNCIDGLDPGNTDNNTYTIKAQQGATVVTLSWTRPCASLRQGVEPGADLSVSVLGNPVAGEAVEFEVRGADGQALRSVVTDSQGRILSERAVQQAGAIERQSLRLGRSAGLYFLNVSTGSKITTVKVVKQ